MTISRITSLPMRAFNFIRSSSRRNINSERHTELLTLIVSTPCCVPRIVHKRDTFSPTISDQWSGIFAAVNESDKRYRLSRSFSTDVMDVATFLFSLVTSHFSLLNSHLTSHFSLLTSHLTSHLSLYSLQLLSPPEPTSSSQRLRWWSQSTACPWPIPFASRVHIATDPTR